VAVDLLWDVPAWGKMGIVKNRSKFSQFLAHLIIVGVQVSFHSIHSRGCPVSRVVLMHRLPRARRHKLQRRFVFFRVAVTVVRLICCRLWSRPSSHMQRWSRRSFLSLIFIVVLEVVVRLPHSHRPTDAVESLEALLCRRHSLIRASQPRQSSTLRRVHQSAFLESAPVKFVGVSLMSRENRAASLTRRRSS
jgi:hypothetical protein